MATVLNSRAVSNIGTTQTTLVNTGTANRYTIIGMSFTNISERIIHIDVLVNGAYYLKNVMIPVGSSLRAVTGGEKLILGFSSTIDVVSDVENSVDAIVSYASIFSSSEPEGIELVAGPLITLDRTDNIVTIGTDFSSIQWNFADETSNVKSIGIDDTLQFVGQTNITTSLDNATGILTITGPDLTNYAQFEDLKFYIASDDSSYKEVFVLDTVKIVGGRNITTSTNLAHNIVIDGPDISSFITLDDLQRITFETDSASKPVGLGDSIKFVGGTAIQVEYNNNAEIEINYLGQTDLSGFALKDNISWSIAADTGSAPVDNGESLTIIGGSNITTRVNAAGNVIIDGPILDSFLSFNDVYFYISADTEDRAVIIGNDVKFIGGEAITTSINGDGNVVIDGNLQNFSYLNLVDVPTTFAGQGITDLPTTLEGYGITDAYTQSEIDNFIALSDPNFTNNLQNLGFYLTADDSTVAGFWGLGQTVQFLGGTGITTECDPATGNITINGADNLTVNLTDPNDVIVKQVLAVNTINFDNDSGFDIDVGTGTVKVKLNSTFKFWKTDGQPDIVADGLDTVRLIAGKGIGINFDPNRNPYQSVTFYNNGTFWITGDDSTARTVYNDNTVQIAGGSNISTSSFESGTTGVTIDLDSNLSVTSVSATGTISGSSLSATNDVTATTVETTTLYTTKVLRDDTFTTAGLHFTNDSFKSIIGKSEAGDDNIVLELETGNILAEGDITTEYTSDERLKNIISPLGNVLDSIDSLSAVKFKWNQIAVEKFNYKDGKAELGFIAQEMQKFYPELVTNRGNTDYLKIDYQKFTVVLLAALQELNQKVKDLERRLG